MILQIYKFVFRDREDFSRVRHVFGTDSKVRSKKEFLTCHDFSLEIYSVF